MESIQLERFMAKVQKEPDDGCWIWTGATTTSKGGALYGVVRVDGRLVTAHRVSHEHFKGPLRQDRRFSVDHLCGRTLCVRPEHLEEVTQRENQRRSPRSNAGKTHCKNGHEFTPENTYRRRGGGRDCRTCQREWARRKRGTSPESYRS